MSLSGEYVLHQLPTGDIFLQKKQVISPVVLSPAQSPSVSVRGSLTEDQRQYIRASTKSVKDLSRELGVRKAVIYYIRSRSHQPKFKVQSNATRPDIT